MSLKPALLANFAKGRGLCMYKKLRLLTCGKRIGVIPSSSTKGKSPFTKIEALYVTRTQEVVLGACRAVTYLSFLSRQTKSMTSPFVFDFGKLKTNDYSTKHLKSVMVFQCRPCGSTTSSFT